MPKNLSGGKTFKKQGSKLRRGERQNQEVAAAFVEDVLEGEIPTDIVLARVTKVLGGGRISLVLPDGATKNAAIRGSLMMSAGAARAPGNVLAIHVNGFILLQINDYGSQVAAVISRTQVDRIKDKIKTSKGFFSVGDATEEDDGFDWDVEEPEVESADTSKAEKEYIDAI